jgi:hypothetical protein
MPAYGKNLSPAETTDLVANEPAREVAGRSEDITRDHVPFNA